MSSWKVASFQSSTWCHNGRRESAGRRSVEDLSASDVLRAPRMIDTHEAVWSCELVGRALGSEKIAVFPARPCAMEALSLPIPR